MGAQNTTDQRGINRCRRSLATDIADHDGGAVQRVPDKIVEVTADGPRWHERGGKVQILDRGKGRRQQSELKLPRHRQVLLQPSLLLGNLLVELGILDGDRNLGGQGGHGPLVIIGKEAAARVLEVKYTNNLILVHQGYRQLRAGFRIERDVARILGDVSHQNGFLVLDGITHDTLSDRDVVLALNIFAKAQGEAVLQLFSRRIEQQNTEHLIVDQSVQQFGDAFQELIEIENRGQLAGNLIQQYQGAGLAAGAGVETGVFDPHGHAGSDQRQQPFMFLGEVVWLSRLEVHHSDE